LISDIVIANVLASACLILIIYLLDVNEKEPPWILVRVYLLSILATFLFGKLKGFLFGHFEWEFPVWFHHYVVAGGFEELLKFLVVMIFVWPLKSFDDETDGIIYYLLAAAGFAVMENVGYSFHFVINPYRFGLATGELRPYHAALRDIVLLRAVSGHIFINVVSGFLLGLARTRRRLWLLPVLLIVSAVLHGLWNQAASTGWLHWFALGLLLLDVFLFMLSLRMSFYFKFMKRLRFRIGELIIAARAAKIDPDTVMLLRGIHRNVRVLRRMQAPALKTAAMRITRLLPARVDAVPLNGEDGLLSVLVKVNGILGRELERTGWRFWVGFFLTFSVSGFFLLMILMNFV